MRGLQLPLGVQLADRATLDNYFTGPNVELVTALRALSNPASRPLLFIYGAVGSGKTHLLQALTAQAASNCAAAYVPLRQFEMEVPDVLEGLDALDLVCLDDLDAIAGRQEWMLAVLRLLDQLRTRGANAVVSAGAAPERLARALPDLVTRLSAAAVFGLKPLNDSDRQRLLQERAAERGLQLAEEAGLLLLAQLPRDTGSLLLALDELDQDSLRAQRRLTVPFVTDWLRRRAVANRIRHGFR